MMLRQIFQEHEGKVSDKWSLYIDEYDRMFSDLRDRPIRLLEIGIQNGGSLEVWAKLFPNAELILGCDLDTACGDLKYDDPRIQLVIGDATSVDVEQEIAALSPSFDIIIDDGSHRSADVISAFARYFKHLKYDGLYIVEDLHCSYWDESLPGTPHAGGLFQPESSVAFFKLLVDIVNHEHWGINKARSELLADFEERYDICFVEGVLRAIHSIEFINSLCIVTKRDPRENLLGIRIVNGTAEAVVPGTLTLDGQLSRAPDQRRNEWSLHEKEKTEDARESEVGELRRVIRRHDQRIVELELVINKFNADQINPVPTGDTQEVVGKAELRALELELQATNLRFAQVQFALETARRAELEARRQLDASDASLASERETWAAQLADVRRSAEDAIQARVEQGLKEAEQAREEFELAISRLEQELAVKSGELATLLGSTIWRCTYPLRVLGRRLPRPLRRCLARTVQFVWHAVRLRPFALKLAPYNSAAPLDNRAASSPLVPPALQRIGTDRPEATRFVDRADIVLVSGFPGSPSEEYRVLNPLSVLAQHYTACAIRVDDIQHAAESLERASIIVLFRVAWSEQLAGIIARARNSGTLIVYDVDDYVFEPAIANPGIIDGIRFLSELDQAAYKTGVAAYRKAILDADCCVVTTEFLATRVRELGKDAYVLPNCVSPAMLRRYDEALRARRDRGWESASRKRIGYATGTLTHQRDFAVVCPALATLLRQRNDITITIVGHLDLSEYPELADFADDIEVRPAVPHDDLPKELARFDINIAPLEVGNPFCEAKSELKFFNAALVEVPTVASATAPFLAAIRDGESGYVAADTAQWLKALTTLLDDRALCRRVALMARSEALRRFGPGTMRAHVKHLFTELFQRRRPITLPRHVGYDHFLYAINYPKGTKRPAGVSSAVRTPPRHNHDELHLQWIIPDFGIGWGGMTNILRIVQQLEKFGHVNTLWIHNPSPKIPRGLAVRDYYRDLIVRHFPPVSADINPLPASLDRISGDVVIATDHASAYPARAVTNVERHFYFLQDNEPEFYATGYAAFFAEQTYHFGFDALSNGDWLHGLAQDYGMWSMKWEQAADATHYFAHGSERRLPGHIAFYARHETPRRTVELGYLAFELLYREGVEFHVDFFGGPIAVSLPYSFTSHNVLSALELGELYRRAAIGLVFSATNYSIIPREMMACGLPVVELNSASSRRSFPDGVAQLAEPTPESVAAHLKSLLRDDARRSQLAQHGRTFASKFSWEKSARDIENALLFRLGRGGTSTKAPERINQIAES